ncbi:glycosyltransferase family 2 protein [Candidatus Woesearchaeota archaeon]|nr:glycosyltransferase family 2 protein [Candidatus Woesearchaeota archaeon]
MLSIVLPALNEERAIGKTLDRINRMLELSKIDAEVIVVNDGSKDRTAEIAKNKGAKVISHKRNLGYGAALRHGFQAAKGKIICSLDADSTYPPEEIPKLYKIYLKRNVDMVVGSRMLSGAKGMPLIRKIGNKLLATFASIMLKTRIVDLSSGMRVISKEDVSKLFPLTDELDFTVKITLEYAAQKKRILEVPIKYEERKGKSKLSSTKHGYMFAKNILHITRDYNPLRIFIPISLFFIITGAIWVLNLIVQRLLFGVSINLTNGLVVTGAWILFGFQIFFFGILADMIASK